ncbi:hypothetical protein, partial [Helicobacter sp. T3_23-1059]
VYASSINHFDNNTAHIKFNLNFEVGIGNDDEVRESSRGNENTTQHNLYNQAINSNDIAVWNQLEHIYSVDEAVWFLKIAYKQFERDKQERSKILGGDFILRDFYKKYPQIACKIAYIYYRFDLGNEDFINNITSDNEVYVWDRYYFINKISIVYICGLCNSIKPNARNYKQEFENICLYSKVDIDWQQLITDFINDICNELNIEKKFRPKIDTNPGDGNFGAYDENTNTISVDKPDSTDKNDLIDFIDTIIHEFRHFYMWYIFEKAQEHKLAKSSVAKLIYHNNAFYISKNHNQIFDAYDKECAIFDIFAESVCQQGIKYSANSDSPIYYIQPSERDSRVVAWNFRQKAGVK